MAPASEVLHAREAPVGIFPAQSASIAQPAEQAPVVALAGTLQVELSARPARVALGHVVVDAATVP